MAAYLNLGTLRRHINKSRRKSLAALMLRKDTRPVDDDTHVNGVQGKEDVEEQDSSEEEDTSSNPLGLFPSESTRVAVSGVCLSLSPVAVSLSY